MPILMQICLVIVTLALITVAVVALRLMGRLNHIAEQLSSGVAAFQASMDETRRTVTELRTFIVHLEEIAQDVRSVSERFERVGTRAADLASDLVGEVGRPVAGAISIARGVRAGAAVLLRRWGLQHQTASTYNGGLEHEHEQ